VGISTQAATGPAQPTRMLRVNEVAGLLGLSRSQVYVLIARGDLASVVIGGKSRRIPAPAYEDFIVRLQREAQRAT
jgi:excisionase family DNA binding protein